MPVAEMRQRVSNDEWIRWNIFYARRAQQIELQQKQARWR